jgi:RNA binding exosome subunit
MAVFHYVHLRAFAHETEDPAKVQGALRQAAQDEVPIRETYVDGSHGNRIIILDAEVKSAPGAKRLFGALMKDDPRGFEEVAGTLRERLDENLNLHLRLDKQEAALGRVALARGDDAITVRAKIRSFESKRSGFPLESSLQQLEAFILAVRNPRGASGGQ